MGMRESIEVRVYLRSEESHARTITLSVPGGNGADGSRATWASARRVSFREKAINRSACRAYSHRVSFAPSHTKLRSRRESSESGDREMDKAPEGVSERE